MLTLYDYLETIIAEQKQRQQKWDARLNYFAREILSALEIYDENAIDDAIYRSLKACESLHIPVEENFKKVFRCNGEFLVIDWKISQLASYLIVVNADPGYKPVAKAQLYFALRIQGSTTTTL